MGVKGLWKLIEDAGNPVPLESLEHKLLAVDVSIWLHQAVRGFRGAGGETVANSHLLTLFHRICKLLFYRIKPVFVFDGGVPQLKKQTMSFRRVRREAAANRSQKVRERLLTNLLKSHAVRNALGRTGPAPAEHRVMPPPKPQQKDMFELPPLPEGETLREETQVKSESSDDEDDNINNDKPRKRKKSFEYKNLHDFDFESKEFLDLSLQKRHEILVELQDSRKDNSWSTINRMPEESSNFSSYQMNRLLKRSKFQETIQSVRSAIQQETSEEMERDLFGDLEKYASQTHRIVSEDSAYSIVIRTKPEVPPAAKPSVNVEKGKSILKKPQKDFLTELMNHGVVSNPDVSNSDSDFDMDDDEGSMRTKSKLIELEEKKSLLQVMDYVMEDDNGLSQDEIMAIIKQSSDEINESTLKHGYDVPSTSSNACGAVANPDCSSESDTDDFIEVPEYSEEASGSAADNGTENLNNNGHSSRNMEAIRASNSSSLYIKIVQHRLDNMLQKDSTPKKAIVDSRTLNSKSKSNDESTSNYSAISPTKSVLKRKSFEDGTKPKGLTLSLEIQTSSKYAKDDLFSDIFSTPTSLPNGNQNSTTLSNNRNDDANTNKKIITVESNDIRIKPTGSTGLEMSNKIAKVNSTHKVTKSNIIVDVDLTTDLQKKVDELVKLQLEEFFKNSTLPVKSSEIIYDANAKSTNYISSGTTEAELQTIVETSSISPEVVSVPDDICLDSDIENDDLIEVDPSETNDREEIFSNEAQPETIAASSNASTSMEIDASVPTVSCGAPSSGSSDLDHKQSHVDVEEENNGAITDESKSDDGTPSMPSSIQNEVPMSNSIAPADTSARDEPISAERLDELKEMEGALVTEHESLVAQVQKVERVASNISQQMYSDAQELLQLFGLPYLVAPMEAEAQCAFLDDVGLTNGTITDDSDAFLFGSKHVYKNFFNQSQHVELYKLQNIEQKFGLDRQKLISLALLTGSDYTEGIEGIGAVSGMEVLSDFSGHGIEALRNFKKWWNNCNSGITMFRMSKVREKLKKVYLPEGFPSEAIYDSYTSPTVDESREKFHWSLPNINALRDFTGEKLGWSRNKTDEILIPVMKRLGIKSSQTRIDSFFNNIRLVKEPKSKSKRLNDAIAKSKGEHVPSSPSKPNNLMDKIRLEQKSKPKKKKGAVTKEPTTIPKSTVLIDVREESTKTSKPKRGRPKKNSKNDLEKDAVEKTSTADDSETSDENVVPLTKEEKKLLSFEKLLQKEKNYQRDASENSMKLKKQQAALLLRSKCKSKK